MSFLLAAAGAKLAASLAVWLLVPCIAATTRFWLPPWYYLALAFVFGFAGFALFFGGRRDIPARYLGATFVFFGTLYADRVLFGRAGCLPAGADEWARVVLAIQPIAFNAFVLWRFAWTFPAVQPGIVHPSVPRVMSAVSLGLGVVLFAGNLAAAIPGLAPQTAGALAWLGTDTPEGQFWLALTLLTVPSLVMLLLKLRAARADERRRLSILVVGMAVATFPMVIDVILTVLWPAFQTYFTQPGRGQMRALVLTLFSLLSPIAAAYAVAVEHVFDVRFIIRRAVRYSLARYSVFVVLAVPLFALGSYMYANRQKPLNDLLAGGSTTMWLLVLTSAVVLLGARRPLLEAIDRHFFREEYDARLILSSLIEGTRQGGPADLNERICAEVDRALHLDRVILLVRDETVDAFRDPQHRIRDLATSTSLAHLVGGAETPLDVELAPARSTMARLSRQERQWLADSGARLLVPFFGTGGVLMGVLVLGDKRSETPFTSEDRMLLMAVAAAAAFALEARIRSEPPLGADKFTSQPAAQCERCGNIQSTGGLAICPACHGHMRPCLLPSVLAGKFAIDRQIGVGGMGVVYQAHDLDLGRPVALKTLPKVAPRHVSRLRREARAMATIHHPHLAVIYATEVWRGLPVLVIEFLAGGTLADRLRGGPLAPDSVIAVGLAMADVLDHVHRAGLLHRDVKPSNIGYTSDGVPKLLDFGLARLTSVTAGPGDTTSLSILKAGSGDDGRVEGSVGGDTQPLVGTAHYLSPEAVSLHAPDHSFDLWALAVTLHEAVTGRNPFAAPTVMEILQRISSGPVPEVRALRPDCPAALNDFLAAALSPDPRRRPATAAEFLSRLQRVKAAVGTSAHQVAALAP